MLLAAVPALASPSITSKRAQAVQAQQELLRLSDSLERARSRYDAATWRLQRIQRDLAQNRHDFTIAKHNLRASQSLIAKRLRSLYMSDQTSTLEVVLGAHSLDDMITGIDSAKSVTQLDANVLTQVKHFRTVVKRSGVRLAQERAAQRQVVAQRSAVKHEIESKITQEQSLYNSLKTEIDRLVAEQRARQLQMARQAQLRLEALRQAQTAPPPVIGATAVDPQATTVVLPPPTHGDVVSYAMSQLGTPYVWAGSAPGGFDCSGLVMWAYSQVGVSLPHSSYAMWNFGVPVSQDQLQPGDIVFFDGLGHVGLYIGGGQFIEAPHTGDVVKISSLGDRGYSYVGARRIL